MKIVPDSVQGLACLILHTLFCMSWSVRPGDAGRGTTGERDCPKMCFCNKLSKIAYCSRRGLPYIPNDLPVNTLQLNLNFNTFVTSVIQRSNFSRFMDLEHLYLSECGIEVIEVDTFRDLTNLKWLDLSNNRIRMIQDNTFRGLTLQHLFLNGNRDIQLDTGSFVGLVTTGLYLHECSLKTLDIEVLSPLNNTLKYLWLNGNELERINKGFSTIFYSLSHLRLGANPLHCNCEVIWIKDFYTNHQDVFEGAIAPSCLTPATLRGKFFNELSPTELRCQSPVFNNIDTLFGSTTGKLKCSAFGDPPPTLYWIQPTGKTSKYDPPQQEDVRKTEGILYINGAPETMDEKNGMYICVAKNDAGNVTLTVNVSFPHLPALTTPSKVQYKTETQSNSPQSPAERGESATVTPTPGSGPGFENTPAPPHFKDKDSTDTPKPSNSVRDQRRTQQGTNYTSLNMFDMHLRRGQRLFNLTELIGAVIGTHVCTLLLCLILLPIYYRRKLKQHTMNSLEKKKPPPAEKLFLNGMGHHPMDYLETPTTSPKR